MANYTYSAESGRAAWFWFETEACKSAWAQTPPEKIDGHVNRLWPLVPAHVKYDLLPLLSKFYTIHRRVLAIYNDLSNTQYLDVDTLNAYAQEQLYPPIDQFATADDRLAVATKLLDTAKAAKLAFLELKQFYNDNPSSFSPEGQHALRQIPVGLDNSIAMAENEIRRVEKDLPECRRMEQKLRMDKRERGDPQGAGWVGTWLLGSGAFGEALLWVRQDFQGLIVDVSIIVLIYRGHR